MINHFIILLVALPLVLLPLLLDSKELAPLLLIVPQVLVDQVKVLQQLFLVQLLAPSHPILGLMAPVLLLPILILTIAEELIQLKVPLHMLFQPNFQHVVTVLIQTLLLQAFNECYPVMVLCP